ncbi:MAG: hypothetical protein RSC92_01750 [Clostridia bacterium]
MNKNFKIFDKENNRYVNSLLDKEVPIEIKMVNEEAFFYYDEQRYNIIDEINITDKNNRKLSIGDYIKLELDDEISIYKIELDNNNLVLFPIDQNEMPLLLLDINKENITYMTSDIFLKTHNLKFLNINCPECLCSILDIIDINSNTYLCKECNEFIDINC